VPYERRVPIEWAKSAVEVGLIARGARSRRHPQVLGRLLNFQAEDAHARYAHEERAYEEYGERVACAETAVRDPVPFLGIRRGPS
jgi:hypothetical protein